ncbi:MAG: hypothetical protein ACLUOC_06790 [Peptoniphilaceae bacterium]
MAKQNDEKKMEFERPNYPSDRFDSLSLKTNRINEETLSAIKEGRRIAVDTHAAYKTIEELKAALEK